MAKAAWLTGQVPSTTSPLWSTRIRSSTVICLKLIPNGCHRPPRRRARDAALRFGPQEPRTVLSKVALLFYSACVATEGTTPVDQAPTSQSPRRQLVSQAARPPLRQHRTTEAPMAVSGCQPATKTYRHSAWQRALQLRERHRHRLQARRSRSQGLRATDHLGAAVHADARRLLQVLRPLGSS
jgi:hypothetical protein